MARFTSVGDFASYCRCVESQRLSNGKVKGKGNTKNGNKYLGWAFVEAAHFAIRFDPGIKRFYQRKQVKSHKLVALKTVTHKLARACYDIIRAQVPFDRSNAFGLYRASSNGWGRELINRVGGQPGVLISHTPIRTYICCVGARCLTPPPLP